MSIALSEKLESIPETQVFAELNELLSKAQVSISWFGRKISIPGYSDTVAIYDVGRVYLLEAIKRDSLNKSAKKTWKCIQSLYVQSDKKLEKTCFFKYFYKYVIPIFCANSVEQTLRGPHHKKLPWLKVLIEAGELAGVPAKNLI